MVSLKELSKLGGRSVAITGATGNLGSVIANAIAELGGEIILIDRHDSEFKKLEDEITNIWNVPCHSYSCDLECEINRDELIKSLVSNHNNLSCLINNAAFVGTSSLTGWATNLENQSIETWRRAFEVNLTSAFHLSKGLANTLKNSKGGNIINISSIYGEYAPDWSLYHDLDMANPAAYASSKGGLIQLSRWLATTLSPDIRVNVISPGGIFRGQPEKFVERYQIKTPLGRMATENDFKGAIAYLASDLSAYVTGHILRVDGGWGIW